MKAYQVNERIFWITLFSIAMAYLESAVVVYLRAIYYEGGFDFPLVPLQKLHVTTEIFREAVTLIMLISIGVLSGRDKWEKFAIFLYTFGVWDVFYYVFLKLLLGWPDSLMTWDILFLIPTTWVGPVVTPIISAATMVLLALIIIYRKNSEVELAKGKHLLWLIGGSVIQIVAYIWDYSRFLFEHGALRYFYDFEKISELNLAYMPYQFPWLIYLTGELIILVGVMSVYKKCLR